MSSVFEAIKKRKAGVEGGGESYDPEPGPDFRPTHYDPGSVEKTKVLAARAAAGQPLWHPDDKQYCNTPGIPPSIDKSTKWLQPPVRKPCDSFPRKSHE